MIVFTAVCFVFKAYFRRGEVHRALIEQPLALSSAMTPHDYRVKAMHDYCTSYQLTNDPTTLSYCVMLSVDLGKAFINILVCLCMHVCVHECVHVCVCVCVCVHVRAHACMHTCVNLHKFKSIIYLTFLTVRP